MGLGDFITDILGSKNKSDATAQQGAPQVRADAYQYGGRANGAANQAADYSRRSWGAQYRPGANVNYDAANWDRMQAGNARNAQAEASNMMLRRASGATPSIARMAADRQMQQAQAAQASQMASARGAGALANAQRNAANNIAGAQSAIANQGQINEAAERLQAEQAAAGAFSNLRGGDLQSQGQAAQQSQYVAQLEDAQRARNDQMTMGFAGLQNQVNTTQLGAQMNQQAQQSANQLGAAGINAGVGGQNAAMNQANALGAISLGANLGGTFATAGGSGGGTPPPKRAEGGPVQGRQPYLVGEQGPELIVPKHDGTVIPAPQTSALLASSTWGTGGPDREQQEIAIADAERARAWNARAQAEAAQYKNPYAEDVRYVRSLRATNPELVDERDVENERRGKAFLRLQRARAGQPADEELKEPAPKTEEKKAVVEGTALPKSATLRERAAGKLSMLGQAMGDMSKGVDTSYHGGPAYVPPHLIPVAVPRAMGGPIQAGGAPPIPDYTQQIASLTGFRPTAANTGIQAGSSGAAAPSFDQMNSAGMDPMGSLRAHGAFGTRFQGDPSGGMMAREEGGPIPAGARVIVGEKGPEMIVPDDPYVIAQRNREAFQRHPGDVISGVSADQVQPDYVRGPSSMPWYDTITGILGPGPATVGSLASRMRPKK